MSALIAVLDAAFVRVVLPPARWSLVWRIPAAIGLALVAVVCYAIDDVWRALRRRFGGGRHGR